MEVETKIWTCHKYFCRCCQSRNMASLKERIQGTIREVYERTNSICQNYNLYLEDQMFVVPIPFSVEGAHMLQHAKFLLEETEVDGSPV